MRSKEKIEEMANELLKVVSDPPSNYDAGVYETCEHYLDCLLWVLEEFDTEDILEGLPLGDVKRK